MSKNFKPIILVAGDPKSVFLEIFFKSLKKGKYKNPLILIVNKKILLGSPATRTIGLKFFNISFVFNFFIINYRIFIK